MPSPRPSDEALKLLADLPEYSEEDTVALNLKLRNQGWSAEAVSTALTQSRLRARARQKLGEFADRMLFTDHGLQQSTRIPVAVRHALRFRKAGVIRVADLGCGLGADSLAFASCAMEVTAVEADPATARFTEVNLRPFPEAKVINITAEEFAAQHDLLDPTAVHTGWGLWLDPARRNEHSRLWDPEEFSPPLSFVTALAQTGIPLGVKLGPGIPHDMIPADCESEWVSIDGSLVEVVLWFNALARPGVRRAATSLRTEASRPIEVTRLSELTSGEEFSSLTSAEHDDGGSTRHTPAAVNSEKVLGAAGLIHAAESGGILWEPDPAVIRAGLVADLCADMDGGMLDERIAYFLTDRPQSAHLARGYQVLEVLPYQPKKLKRWVLERGFTSLEIKKRGVDVVPEQLRAQLLPKKSRGNPPRHGLLVITRLGDQRMVASVSPLPHEAAEAHS